ncbi:MAG TPA: hypothetical protein VIK64_04970 [Anaerolineales bacterium]|jgi:predicted RNA-binding Zn-ribbon protein involved in translation (DUF1610 family)
MIALYDFVPRYCPYCGQATAVMDEPSCVADFSSNFSFACTSCGVIYQKAHTRQLLRLARESGGDLHRNAVPATGLHNEHSTAAGGI